MLRDVGTGHRIAIPYTRAMVNADEKFREEQLRQVGRALVDAAGKTADGDAQRLALLSVAESAYAALVRASLHVLHGLDPSA